MWPEFSTPSYVLVKITLVFVRHITKVKSTALTLWTTKQSSKITAMTEILVGHNLQLSIKYILTKDLVALKSTRSVIV